MQHFVKEIMVIVVVIWAVLPWYQAAVIETEMMLHQELLQSQNGKGNFSKRKTLPKGEEGVGFAPAFEYSKKPPK